MLSQDSILDNNNSIHIFIFFEGWEKGKYLSIGERGKEGG